MFSFIFSCFLIVSWCRPRSAEPYARPLTFSSVNKSIWVPLLFILGRFLCTSSLTLATCPSVFIRFLLFRLDSEEKENTKVSYFSCSLIFGEGNRQFRISDKRDFRQTGSHINHRDDMTLIMPLLKLEIWNVDTNARGNWDNLLLGDKPVYIYIYRFLNVYRTYCLLI